MKFQEAKKHTLQTLSSEAFRKDIQEEDPKMVKFIPTFLEINRLDFLTTNSQAGHYQKGKSVFTGKPYTSSERAYLEGFLPEAKAEQFIKNMALHTDKNAIYVPSCSSLDIPRKLDIPLTITESEGKQEIHTHMSTAVPTSLTDMLRKQLKLNKSEKVVYIFCWDNMWNRPASKKNGLFSEVIRILKMSNQTK